MKQKICGFDKSLQMNSEVKYISGGLEPEVQCHGDNGPLIDLCSVLNVTRCKTLRLFYSNFISATKLWSAQSRCLLDTVACCSFSKAITRRHNGLGWRTKYRNSLEAKLLLLKKLFLPNKKAIKFDVLQHARTPELTNT